MPKGVYERTPEMKTGKHERTPEICDAISKGKAGISISPRTPEHSAALSESLKNSDAVKAATEARRGVPLPPEWCDAVSDGRINSDAVKAEAERQRGGNDICNHHYIYDHSDLSKYTMKMTRSTHARLHNNMSKAGIKVPHINIEETEND